MSNPRASFGVVMWTAARGRACGVAGACCAPGAPAPSARRRTRIASRRCMPRILYLGAMFGWPRVVIVGLVVLAAQTPQFRSGIDVVRFDVVVLDKARHPVAGLTVQDFRVTEDGRPLRVAGFEAVTIPPARRRRRRQGARIGSPRSRRQSEDTPRLHGRPDDPREPAGAVRP